MRQEVKQLFTLNSLETPLRFCICRQGSILNCALPLKHHPNDIALFSALRCYECPSLSIFSLHKLTTFTQRRPVSGIFKSYTQEMTS